MPADRIRHMFTKAVGVSYENDDGTRRQAIIPRCQPYERLALEHDDTNQYDPNAVKVRRQTGEHIGWLNRRLAAEVVSKSRKGYRFAAFVKNITGGTGRKRTYGMNLVTLIAEPGVPDEEAQAYADRLLPALLAEDEVRDRREPTTVVAVPGQGQGCGLQVIMFAAAVLGLAAWLASSF